jgi:hypothetical protein
MFIKTLWGFYCKHFINSFWCENNLHTNNVEAVVGCKFYITHKHLHDITTITKPFLHCLHNPLNNTFSWILCFYKWITWDYHRGNDRHYENINHTFTDHTYLKISIYEDSYHLRIYSTSGQQRTQHPGKKIYVTNGFSSFTRIISIKYLSPQKLPSK